MTNIVRLGVSIIAALVAAAAGAGAAEAQKKMAVVVDATGSMDIRRISGDPCVQGGQECTRLGAAKLLTERRIQDEVKKLRNGQTLAVAVYSFSGSTGVVMHTDDEFVAPAAAITAVRGISIGAAGTPLADGICHAAQRLYDQLTSTRILHVVSDGVDNLSTGGCAGLDDGAPPYDPASWQAKVWSAVHAPAGVTALVLHVDLYTEAAVGTPPSELEAFYRSLSADMAGTLRVVRDSEWLPLGTRSLVLVDASSSMASRRWDGRTLYEAAVQMARERIMSDAMSSEWNAFAVYTFRDTRMTAQTGGFVGPNQALAVLQSLAIAPGGTSPLAASLCDSADRLAQQGAQKWVLHLFSAFVESGSQGHACHGPETTDPEPPYSPGSWQRRFWDKLQQPGMVPIVINFGS
jgi:hypothetical protein